MTIRRRKKTTKNKKRNPITSEIEILDEPIGGDRNHVTILYKGVPIYKETMSRAKAAMIKTSKGKQIIADVLSQNLKRRNPTSQKDEKKEEQQLIQTSLGPIGMPPDPVQAYRLGYAKGMEDGLDKCGIFNFWERRQERDKLYRNLKEALQRFHEQQAAIGKIPGAKMSKIRG